MKIIDVETMIRIVTTWKLVYAIKLSQWVKSELLSGSSSLNNRNNRKNWIFINLQVLLN